MFAAHFKTPMQRADINSALERHTMMAMTPGVKAPTDINNLLIPYGKKREATSKSEQIQRLNAWARAVSRQQTRAVTPAANSDAAQVIGGVPSPVSQNSTPC